MSKPSFELPGYEILDKLGEGGMAVVWKARQLSLDRIVAIKTLMPEWRQDADAMSRFRKEAMSAARLKHSGIIQVFDAGETADAVYFVMEYVEGYTIGHRIHKRGALDEETALDITLGVAAALSYAWDTAKMIHCDIKPDNIMIDHDGTVKVADLGLARALGPTGTTGEDEYIVGTPNYISPEQARGESNLDCGTDVYALGATLYHMVTGRLPFGDTPGTAPLERQQTDFLLDPLDLNPNLTPALGALIERLMIKDRQLRCSSWTEVIADLQEVREGYLPRGELPPPGASTVLRGAWRTANPGQHRSATIAPKKNVVTISSATVEAASATLTSAPRTPAHARRPRNWAVVVSQIVIMSSLIVIGGGAIYIYLLFNGKLPASHHEPAAKLRGENGSEGHAVAPPPKTSVVPAKEPATPAKTVVVLATPPPAPAAAAEVAAAKKVVPPPAPLPTATTNGAPAVRPSVAQHSPQYQRAARFYNYALGTYRQYTGRMSIPLVQRIETACRQAVSDFNACPEAQAEKAEVDQLVQRCYQLLADARLSSKVTNAPGVTSASLPPLPSMALPAGPTPESTTTIAKTNAPTPVAAPAIQPQPVDEAVLAAAWKTKPSLHTAVMEEFRDLFSLYAPDPDAGLQNLLLYDRIAYGMNAAEAARVLGAKAGAMKPLPSPLFPKEHYFLHDVALPPSAGFDRLLLVVDHADRVVAVQLLTEKPAGIELQLPASLFQSRWKCYDFIRVTTKPSTEWRIAYRVALVGRLARLDSELAAYNDAAPLGLGAPRARSYLYFPQALAARMLERVDTP